MHSTSNVTTIDPDADGFVLESFGTAESDDYMNANSSFNQTAGLKSTCITSPTVRHNNPLLSQTDVEMRPIKKETLTEDLNHKKTLINNAPVMDVDKPFRTSEKQNQQKLLLFMNTPENRAKLAGTNYNIINASILSKISPQYCPTKSSSNMISFKNCIKLSTNIKKEPNSPSQIKKTDELESNRGHGLRWLPLRRECMNGIDNIFKNSLTQGLGAYEKDNHALDSGK